MNNPDEPYTPILHRSKGQRLALIAVGTTACPVCEKVMLDCPADSLKRCGSNWGAVYDGGNTIEAQCRRADFVLVSRSVGKDGERICQECSSAGRNTFVCAHCKQEKPTSVIHESFGDPAEHLCTECYTTTPAAQWDSIVDALNNAHRYDFE